jgi:hypothetical protein
VSLQVDLVTGAEVAFGELTATEVVLTRRLGEAVRWRFTVHLPRGPEGAGRLAQLIDAGPVAARPVWRPGEGEAVVLGPDAALVGAAWLAEDRDDLRLDAQATAFAKHTPAPLLPRSRVHHPDHLLTVMKSLAHVAQVSRAAAKRMEEAVFPDGERTSIIQDGVSDWQFLGELLAQAGALEPTAALRHLACIGSVDEEGTTAGRWLVTWAEQGAYRHYRDVRARHVAFAENDGVETLYFSSYRGEDAAAAALGAANAVTRRVRTDRPFNAAKWKAWRTRDLPWFTHGDDRFVWGVEDRLYATNTPGRLGWGSSLDTLAAGSAPAPAVAPAPPRPWLGLGVVAEEPDAAGPWITVRLPHFEATPEGANLVHARLSTPFAGPDGRAGLHLVPAQNTEVLLAWSGRFGQPVVVLGNVRSAAAAAPAPSLFLGAAVELNLAALTVHRVGPVQVQSDLAVSVDKAVHVSGKDKVELSGGGVRARLAEGFFETEGG